jgi:hypothetical protein
MTISNNFVTLNTNDSRMVHNGEKLRLDLNSPRSVDVFKKKKVENWTKIDRVMRFFLNRVDSSGPMQFGDF